MQGRGSPLGGVGGVVRVGSGGRVHVIPREVVSKVCDVCTWSEIMFNDAFGVR